MSTPAIILIRPQMGENIGSVARAMSNFGLDELRIVAPRDGWPNIKANEMAASAEYIINSATIYSDFTAAMKDIHTAYATTARPRHMSKRVISPETAVKEIITAISDNQKSALVFGPERSGIENEEITLCDNIITIPISEKNPSLNLAQASVIIGYEWLKINNEIEAVSERKDQTNSQITAHNLAAKYDIFNMFEQLEKYLDENKYFRTENKKPIMWQNLKNMLLRGKWSEQEIRSFRGMIRSLWEYHKDK